MQVQVEVKVTSFDTNTLCKGRMTVTINVRENRMDNPEAQLGTRHKKRQTNKQLITENYKNERHSILAVCPY